MRRSSRRMAVASVRAGPRCRVAVPAAASAAARMNATGSRPARAAAASTRHASAGVRRMPTCRERRALSSMRGRAIGALLCPRSVRGRRPRFALAKTASRSYRLWCGGECKGRVPSRADKRLPSAANARRLAFVTPAVLPAPASRRQGPEGPAPAVRWRPGSGGSGKADRGGLEQSCSPGGRDAVLRKPSAMPRRWPGPGRRARESPHQRR